MRNLYRGRLGKTDSSLVPGAECALLCSKECIYQRAVYSCHPQTSSFSFNSGLKEDKHQQGAV